jgi:hypothetical protein
MIEQPEQPLRAIVSTVGERLDSRAPHPNQRKLRGHKEPIRKNKKHNQQDLKDFQHTR